LYSDASDIITPEQNDIIQQQYKGNILQYKGNSSNYSQKMIYSKIIQGKWTNRKKCYAAQQVKYTNPNIYSFTRRGGLNSLLNGVQTNYPLKCPQNNNLVFYNSNQRADPTIGVISNGGVFICSQQSDPCSGFKKTNPPSTYCFPTTCSDVPGKEMFLCYKPTNSYYPQTKRVMTDVGGEFPNNYKGLECSSANGISSDAPGCG
jgi:hypothetical protein